MRAAILWMSLIGWMPARTRAADEARPTIATATATFERHDGLLTLFFDREHGKLWLQLPPPGERGVVGEFLYVEGLQTGLGSNPIGLDRSQLGETIVVRLRRLGPRVLLEHVNVDFRADSTDPDERRAVEQSFATSVLWGQEIGALDGDGSALVDFTSFVVRDAHGAAETLRRSDEGSFAVDPERSVVDLDSCLVFPDNIELEALLTLSGSEPGREVRSVAPTPTAVSFVQHHSLIRLPEPGYRPRPFDPRGGSFAIDFADYAMPLSAPTERRLIVRHRLEKRDPSAARSKAKRPLVYYVDRGVPEPVRSALIDGAGWWAEAFERAGFVDAYQVKLLPPGAHPLDVRYNVIQWVHRATRGWSYGGGIIDPRTGEMLKGHVLLGSLRVRHDRLLFEALGGADNTGSGAVDDPIELALARIRQLAAHEVGHTLGLTHNFAASTYGDRASVLDYPAPRVLVTDDGELDFSQAYGVGLGAWDLHAVQFAYAEAAPGVDESAMLEGILEEGAGRGYLFLSDDDARGADAAHPLANLWDDGADPIAQLAHTLRVREIGLRRFGERNIAAGRPLGLLEDVLAPLYFLHRYQLDAAAKSIGGRDYAYALRDRPVAGPATVRPVAVAQQERALNTILELLAPSALEIPATALDRLLPRPFGHGASREQVRGYTRHGFDPLAAAATASDMVVAALLEPHRAARLVDQHHRDPRQLSLERVLESLVAKAFGGAGEAASNELTSIVQTRVVADLIELAGDASAASWVRARVEQQIGVMVGRELAPAAGEAAHRRWLRQMCVRHLERAQQTPSQAVDAPSPPPGSPIGDGRNKAVDECAFTPPATPSTHRYGASETRR